MASVVTSVVLLAAAVAAQDATTLWVGQVRRRSQMPRSVGGAAACVSGAAASQGRQGGA